MFKLFKKLLVLLSVTFVSLSLVEPVEVLALGYSKDTEADHSLLLDQKYLDLIDAVVQGELDHMLSGAQLAVYKEGQLVIDESWGYTNNFYNTFNEDGSVNFKGAKALPVSERNAVTSDTLFDLASNTKMYSAVFALQKLVDEGKVTLDTLIKDIFPEFTDHANEKGWKDIITLEHVLSHYAGFAPDPQYHNNHYDEDDGIPNGKNDLFSQNKDTTFEMIMKTPVTTKPGTSWAYSDVDMMLAGFIVEHLTGKDLDTYVKETFYIPLGLDRITFNPLEHGFKSHETTSSEVHGNTRDGRIDFDNVRQTVVTGEVHDEKAYYAMGGVSGHAGLFGNARQVAYLAQAMFDGTLDGQTFFSKETISKFTETAALSTQSKGGWRRRNASTGASGWFSVFSPEGTIGHTGWSGTVTFIDPVNKITMALFTTRTNTPIHGPGANDFWTANSNVTSYGAISEFVYQALGLGNGKSSEDTLVNMLSVEIGYDYTNYKYVYPTQELIDSYTPAKRNVIRALLQSLEIYEAKNGAVRVNTVPDFRNRVSDAKKYLQSSAASDLHFLLVTKTLDTLLDDYKSMDKSIYTETSIESVDKLVASIYDSLENTPTQSEIDGYVETLSKAMDSMKVKVIKKNLKDEIDRIENKKIESKDYAELSYNNLSKALSKAKEVLLDEEASQEEVDAALKGLTAAFNGLEVFEETEIPDKDVDKEEKPLPDKDTDEPKEESPLPGKDTQDKKEETKDVLPSTGDVDYLLYVAIGSFAFATLLVYLKRKHEC